MAREEEFDRWLADALAEGLSVLREESAPRPHPPVGRDHKDVEAAPFLGRRWQDPGSESCEPLALRMLGVFTLLVMHAKLDPKRDGMAQEKAPRLRAPEAVACLRAAIQEASVGDEEAAMKHVATALRRLHARRRCRQVGARIWAKRQGR